MAKFKKKQYKILNNVKCDINWDNCVDIKRRNDGDDFIVYQKKEEPEIIDDYYNKKYKRYNSVKINKNKNNFLKLINNYFKYDNLMVQRRQHECFEAKIQRIKSCININNDISRNILEGKYMFKDDKKNENKLVDDLNNNEKNYENNINDDKNFHEEYNDMLMNNLYYDL